MDLESKSPLAIPSIRKNVSALYAVQIVRYIFPLLSVPFLARVLGPQAWGTVLVAQAVYLWGALVVEYGFNLSATREIAKLRATPHLLPEFIANVQGAKLLLSLFSMTFVLMPFYMSPALRDVPATILFSWLAAVSLGLQPIWYFQGLERMVHSSLTDVFGQVLYILGVFAFVKDAHDGWKVLLMLFLANLFTAVYLNMSMYKDVSLVLPSFTGVRHVLREGASLFIFRSAASFYSSANIFVLSLLSAPSVVSSFGGAERINRSLLGLFSPVSQALFPRLSNLMFTDMNKAASLVRRSLYVIVSIGIASTIFVYFFSRWIVTFLLGGAYMSAVPILKVLSLLVPIIALSNALGVQWMLPMKLDRQFNVIIISAGILNLILAFFLGKRFGALGMAWAVVTSEALVSISMFSYLSKNKISPFVKYQSETK